VCSLDYTDNLIVFFRLHHMDHCCTNVIQGHRCAQVCSKNDLTSFFTDVTKWPGLVAKAGKRWTVVKSSGAKISGRGGGEAPMKQSRGMN
jgi:hypothetical protein